MGFSKHCVALLWIPVFLKVIFVRSDFISCKTTHVRPGDVTQVICNFNRNINESKTAFAVSKYPIDDEEFDSRKRKDVIGCNWGKGDSLVCNAEEGYKFNYKVSSTVAVTIPSASKDNEGFYKCQLVLPESIPTSLCELRLEPEKERNAAHEVISAVGPAGILGIIAALLALIVLAIVVLVCYRFKHKKYAQNEKDLRAIIDERDQTIRDVKVNQFTVDQGTEMELETREQYSNTDKIITAERGSNTDPNFTSSLNVGSSRILASNASLGSTQSQQVNSRKKGGKGSVESLINPPAHPVLMRQYEQFDERDEDRDDDNSLQSASGSLLQYEGGDGSVQYTQSPDDSGQGEDTSFYAEDDGTRVDNEKKSGKKKGIFSGFRRSKTNKN